MRRLDEYVKLATPENNARIFVHFVDGATSQRVRNELNNFMVNR